jgi:outer membrane protein OmpA-like peptidoglycan-associated protein
VKSLFRQHIRLSVVLALVIGAVIAGAPVANAAQTIVASCDAASNTMGTATPGETITFTVTGGACVAFITPTGHAASVTVTYNNGSSTTTTPSISAGGVDSYQYADITQVVVVVPNPIVGGVAYAFRTALGPSTVYVNYNFVEGAPTPSPAPAPAPTSPAATPTATAPVAVPALPVSDIPAMLSIDFGSAPSAAAEQPIIAEVPCTAPEGTTLASCTVNITAPQSVLLGQGDGVNVRADKRVSIGRATVNATGGKKTIIVKVKINAAGRKALQRNLKISAKVGLTAVTVANQSSTGEATTEMQLPTQLVSPESGIFDSNSISLNKAGVAFVNRLAKLLPKAPKKMVFIGFADNTGVPGDNRWLGDRRAKAVRDALEAKGITAVKSSIETKAARSPRDDNAKESGRERNRRVSIRITY